ncbi:hypothetical protein [Ferrovibrio sp.]|uniref:hypothetical protein n=1 Tax=Ferrovibrio sp. TaxID=1917215 RepID=UPI0025BA5A3C|nr:hypothetical protein [Ferrovibrio sp.]
MRTTLFQMMGSHAMTSWLIGCFCHARRVCDHVFGEGNAVGMRLRTGSATIPTNDDGDEPMRRAMRRRGKADSAEIRHSADGARPADNAGQTAPGQAAPVHPGGSSGRRHRFCVTKILE